MEPDSDDEDEETQRKSKYDPLTHKLVKPLVPEYLDELDQAEAAIVELEAEKKEFESRGSNNASDEDSSDEEATTNEHNHARDLANEIKDLKYSIKPLNGRIKTLGGSARKSGSIAAARRLGQDTSALEEELRSLKAEIEPVEQRIEEIETELQPYKEIKERLTAARRELRELKTRFIKRLEEARAQLTEGECEQLVLNLLLADLTAYLDAYITAHRQLVIRALENLWDKYRVTLGDIERERDVAMIKLAEFTSSLGYII
jgi:type I restriction enzyme M protein